MQRLIRFSFFFAFGALSACGAVPATTVSPTLVAPTQSAALATSVPASSTAAPAPTDVAAQPTASTNDAIIAAAEEALQTVRFTTPGTLHVEQVEGDFARVQRIPDDLNAADPAYLYVKRTNGAWRVVAGPGTAFGPEDMQADGVPQVLWLPVAQPSMPSANSVEAAVAAAMQASNSVVVGTPYTELTDGAFSRIRFEPTDPNSTDPAYFFVKQAGSAWQVVAGPGTAFEAEDMQAAGVPQDVWLGSPEEAITKLLQTTSATTFTLDVRGIDHNYARVELVPNNGDDAATAFLHLRNGAWQIVQGVEGPHDEQTLRQLGIPERLISGVPAHGGIALPPEQETLCNDAQTALQSALKVDVTQVITDVQNPTSNENVLGCQLTATGTGAQFASPFDVSGKILGALTQQGWREDQAFQADSPVGTATGVRKEPLLGLLNVGWAPAPEANCPQDEPIDACKLAPEQKHYTITLSLLAENIKPG